MRSFIFTLGFHEDFILRRLSQKGAIPGEPIVVFTAHPLVSGVVRAFDSLVSFCSRLGLEKPTMIPLDLSSVAESMVKARSVITALPKPIVADLGGGFRSLVILVFLVLLTTTDDFELYISVEGGEGMELHIPSGVAKALRRFSPEKEEILRAISQNPGIRVEGLSLMLGKSPKTIRNHLSELKKMGLVIARGRGAPLKLTDWGKALVNATR